MGTATSLIGVLPTYLPRALFPAGTGAVEAHARSGSRDSGAARCFSDGKSPKAKRGLYGSIAQARRSGRHVLANLAFWGERAMSRLS